MNTKMNICYPTSLLVTLRKFCCYILVPMVLLSGISISLQAQDTEEDDQVFELSPFEVSTDENVGYLARNTLAGTRIRTNLEDVAASVQVVTKEFIRDTSSSDLEDLLVYTTNTEVAGSDGNFSAGFVQFRGLMTAFNNMRSTNRETRVRGLEKADRTRSFFSTNIPLDTYNTEVVEINRGANAALFGLGSPAGIINQTLIRPIFDSRLNIGVKVDDYGSFRSTFDGEREVIEDQLSIRFAALYDDQKYSQEEAFSDGRRTFITASFRPAALRKGRVISGSTFNVSFEKGQVDSKRPSPAPPIDAISDWFANGKPVWDPRFDSLRTDWDKTLFERTGRNAGAIVYSDPTSSKVGLPAANGSTVTILPNTIRGVKGVIPNFDGTGDIAFGWMRPAAASAIFRNIPGGNPFDNHPQILDERVFPYRDHLLDGKIPGESFDFQVLELSWDLQMFDNTLAFRFSGVRETTDELRFDYNLNSVNSGYISVDLNTHLPTGEENPNFGRPFTQNQGFTRGYFDERDIYRAEGYYKLDLKEKVDGFLGKLLGVHNFSASYTDSTTEEIRQNGRAYVMGPEFGAIGNNSNSATSNNEVPRTFQYLGDSIFGLNSLSEVRLQPVSGGVRRPETLTPSDGGMLIWNSDTGEWENTFVSIISNLNGSGVPMPSNVNIDRIEIESISAVLQSQLWNGLIVPTLSWRQDTVDSYPMDISARNAGRDSARGFYSTDPEFLKTAKTPDTFEEDTFGWGLVVKVPQALLGNQELIRSATVFYNDSENFLLTGERVNFYGESFATQTGTNEEYGFSLDMLGGRIYLRATWYETSQLNINQGGTVLVANTNVDLFLNPVNVLTQLGGTIDAADLQDLSPGITQAEVDSQIQALLDPANAFPYSDIWSVTPDSDGLLRYTTPSQSTAVADRASEGFELEVTMNPTSNWRVTFNVAQQEAFNSNTAVQLQKFVNELKPYYAQWGDLPTNVNFTRNVKDLELINIDSELAQVRLLDQTSSPELREWRFNLITNYEFMDGPLQNWSVGGAVRWQDKPVIGYYSYEDPENPGAYLLDAKQAFYGSTQTRVDFWVGYKTMVLNDRAELTVKLNIRNLLDDDDLIPIRADPVTGVAETFYFTPGREFALSASLQF